MRLFTLPAAIRIERCPMSRGVAGAAQVMQPRAHLDVHTAKAIYVRLRDREARREPAVCVELGDALWLFVMTSDELATHWTDQTIQIAGAGR